MLLPALFGATLWAAACAIAASDSPLGRALVYAVHRWRRRRRLRPDHQSPIDEQEDVGT
jgi:hypothetical protein